MSNGNDSTPPVATARARRGERPFLYVDPASGIAGDMFLGALVDLGPALARLEEALAPLGFPGPLLSARRVRRGGMSGCKVEVVAGDESPASREAEHAPPQSAHARTHEHEHEHHHAYTHAHKHEHHHAHKHEHRTFADIRRLVEGSGLSAAVKERSLAVFSALAEAEGKIHGRPPAEIGFHEVGSVDGIVDVVGACAGLELLGVEEVLSAPPAVGGGGYVSCEHGRLPVPAPATLELLRGLPLRPVPVEAELVTPTGAALLRGLVSSFGPPPPMMVERIGYGAGTRENPGMPNLLRVFLARRTTAGGSQSGESDFVCELQTNLDDVTPQELSRASEQLFAAGALDVFCLPTTGKKSRPGFLLTVLCAPGREEETAAVLFRETGTFGVRLTRKERRILRRASVTVETPYGPVRVKVGRRGGEELVAQPEYEDCRARAEEAGVSFREAWTAAREVYRRERDGGPAGGSNAAE